MGIKLVCDVKRGAQSKEFENKALRECRPKRKEATQGWRKLHKEELCNL
jgi:hypothetical protein